MGNYHQRGHPGCYRTRPIDQKERARSSYSHEEAVVAGYDHFGPPESARSAYIETDNNNSRFPRHNGIGNTRFSMFEIGQQFRGNSMIRNNGSGPVLSNYEKVKKRLRKSKNIVFLFFQCTTSQKFCVKISSRNS